MTTVRIYIMYCIVFHGASYSDIYFSYTNMHPLCIIRMEILQDTQACIQYTNFRFEINHLSENSGVMKLILICKKKMVTALSLQ